MFNSSGESAKLLSNQRYMSVTLHDVNTQCTGWAKSKYTTVLIGFSFLGATFEEAVPGTDTW